MQGITTASSRPGHPAAAAGRTIGFNPPRKHPAGQADIFAHKKCSTNALWSVGCTRVEEVNKASASLHLKSCSALKSHLWFFCI